ncbi:MAG TPA: peptidoglycan DD-metalloendopeptidase family protein [Candidatus Dormibacteraeota bacterium]|nr:peptidoglycan DD-metalloendopeptidase family protein [Candidatus Dormibacteraeota bacterium]
MRRSAPALALLLTLLAPAPALATSSPAPSPSPSSALPASPAPSPSPSLSPLPSPSPSPSLGPSPTPSPSPTGTAPAPGALPAQPTSSLSTVPPQVVDRARAQLGDAVASALSAQQRLAGALDQDVAAQRQLQGQLVEAQRQLQAAEQARGELEARIATTRQRVAAERAQLVLLARLLYEQPDSLLLQLLEAGSPSDLVGEIGDLTEVGLRAHALEAQLQDDLRRLQDEEAQRAAEEARARQLQAQLGAWSGQLQQLQARMQATLDQLQGAVERGQAALAGSGSSLAEQVAAAEDQLLGQLSALAEQEVWEEEQLWAQLNPGEVSSLPVPGPAASPGPAGAVTAFVWPVRGFTLTQGFGPTSLALEPSMFGYPHFHTGIDLAVPVGTPVAAAAAGEVVLVGDGTTGYGTYVVIAHGGGLVTLYGHLSQALVAVGERVDQGQVIGLSGSTGASTGPHLHFEVRLNGEPVDPLGYLPAAG